MKFLFVEYPKCSTCKKAKKWLEDNQVEFEDRNIVTQCPTKAELRNWIQQSKLDIQKFFNTSGIVYKELKLKEKLKQMSDEKKLELLASNGMLIKRPILIGDGEVVNGFKEEEWKKMINGR